MIELQNIYKSYPAKNGSVAALIDINLTVESGQILGVIGKSGAGKSTLIRCVNWLEQPSRGVVRIAGQALHELSTSQLRLVRRQIGMVFQHFNLLSRRTVYENVALPLELLNIDKSSIRQRVEPLLELTGLTEKRNVYPFQLSGGQKQRVAIARALTTKPQVLLCDEMTSSLDPETTRSILQLVKQINQELKLSILLITHEMAVIKMIADYVAVMDHGRIVEQADVFQLFTHPQSAVAKSFVQTILPTHLSEDIKQKLSLEPMPNADFLWRLTFLGEVGGKPIISQLLHQYAIDINIIYANLEALHGQTLGMMIVKVSGDHTMIEEAREFLLQQGARVERMGYVVTND